MTFPKLEKALWETRAERERGSDVTVSWCQVANHGRWCSKCKLVRGTHLAFRVLVASMHTRSSAVGTLAA